MNEHNDDQQHQQSHPTQHFSQQQQPNKPAKNRKPLPQGVRITLTILKYLLIPGLCVAALFTGLAIGYSYIGGEPASDVFKFSTWKHLFDLVFHE